MGINSKLKKTSGTLSFFVSASATINPEFSSSHLLDLVSGLFSSRYSFFEDRLTSLLPFHFYRPLQISIWETFGQKMDGQSFPASFPTLDELDTSPVNNRKEGWLVHICISCLGTVAGKVAKQNY